jgi:hypothetical protein
MRCAFAKMQRVLFLPSIGIALTCSAIAGRPISELQPKSISETNSSSRAGSLSLGWKSSEDLQGGYVDFFNPVWNANIANVFFNGRVALEGNSQEVYSIGSGFRYLLPNHEVIFGANAYYDSIASEHGHDFNQFGFGAEVLTRWVDARFNYYLPDGDQVPLDRDTHTAVEAKESDQVLNGSLFSRTITETVTRQTLSRFEAALEGWNAEAGVLIPGLERFCEVRLFAGYYHYDNPFDGDFEGWKARIEARPLPGLTVGIEYWEDEGLNGGHWTGEVRVSVPFDLHCLARGQNPFVGAAEAFRPRQHDFRERIGEYVVRSHRIKTVTSEPQLIDVRRESESRVLLFVDPNSNPPAPPPPPPPPPPPGGEL